MTPDAASLLNTGLYRVDWFWHVAINGQDWTVPIAVAMLVCIAVAAPIAPRIYWRIVTSQRG